MDAVSDWLLFLSYLFVLVPVLSPPVEPTCDVATPLFAGLYVFDRSRPSGSTVLVTRSSPLSVYVVCFAFATVALWSERGSATWVEVLLT